MGFSTGQPADIAPSISFIYEEHFASSTQAVDSPLKTDSANRNFSNTNQTSTTSTLYFFCIYYGSKWVGFEIAIY
jgi:uncharacterized membrane protein YkgB